MPARVIGLSLMMALALPGLVRAHEFTYTALLTGSAQSPPNASPGSAWQW